VFKTTLLGQMDQTFRSCVSFLFAFVFDVGLNKRDLIRNLLGVEGQQC
jgi:hypothetical protein